MANSAIFRIRSVKCRDEMGGKYREKFGNDEIKCAVFSADLRGSTRNSGRIDIYDNFDDGDIKRFDPPKEVVTLDLAGAEGEAELAFSVLLIESQASEGNSLKKAWDEFVALYADKAKKELESRNLTMGLAQAIAQPGYLRPTSNPSPLRGPLETTRGAVGSAWRGVGTIGTRVESHAAEIASSSTIVAGEDVATEKEKDEFKDKVGEAFIAAAVTAVVTFAIKFGGDAISALIGWAQDKLFAPVPINAKIDASSPPETVPPNASGVAEFRGHGGIYEMEWDILVR